jgi:hypothetical protein
VIAKPAGRIENAPKDAGEATRLHSEVHNSNCACWGPELRLRSTLCEVSRAGELA